MYVRIAAAVAGLTLALGIVAGAAASVPPPPEVAVLGGPGFPGCLMCPGPGFNPN